MKQKKQKKKQKKGFAKFKQKKIETENNII